MFPDVPHTGLPLSGLTVLDVTVWQQGTYATAMLADFGANVIKIEGPDSPDPGRGVSDAYFESHNRNKRGIVVDLKTPEGRETVLRLAEKADVFVQNMRQGVLEKLGLAYADVKARNPRIIYASASGYGSKGPHRTWPAMDILGQARGGTMMTQGPPDLPPIFSFGGMADQDGAISLSYGILLALWHRARTGEGQQLDASLLGGQVMLQSFNITGTLFTGAVPPRRSREHAAPMWNVYQCRDGGWIALSMSQIGRWWRPFCEAIERLDLRDDPRFCTLPNHYEHRTEIIAELDRLFAQRDQWDWVEYLCGQGLPVAPVQDYAQVISDPQVAANEYIVEYDHPSGERRKIVGPAVQLETTPGSIRSGAPEFGQHTEEVLLEFGFEWEEIERLRHARAIGGR
ncbi:MAG TPA: CoA transferase [Tepidiformaceae bacterium]|nr:CoA transferase [Tepidiformaceae bacterium]